MVIEGQAGTGKSTTLTGIARAHQAAGQQILVTSTAALAAERLADELAAAGVGASSYSTAVLHAAIQSGRAVVAPDTTVIHAEAALASTTEQSRLLMVIETSGARLIEIGDAAQSQPVGAGGLWLHLERTARDAGAQVELTRTSAHWTRMTARTKHGFGAASISSRSAATPPVTASTSPLTPPVPRISHSTRPRKTATPGRPRSSSPRPQTSTATHSTPARRRSVSSTENSTATRSQSPAGHTSSMSATRCRSDGRSITPITAGCATGTVGRVVEVDPTARRLVLDVGAGHGVALDESQLAGADLRLTYVQHPFPAQGQTTDTSHVVVSGNATAEGSYVAITRARERTDLYAGIDPAEHSETDRLQVLAERVSRTEPELPSIDVPLRHERLVTIEPDQLDSELGEPTIAAQVELAGIEPPEPDRGTPELDAAPTARPHISVAEDAIAGCRPESGEADASEGRSRRWPRSRHDGQERETLDMHHELERPGRTHSWGWEP